MGGRKSNKAKNQQPLNNDVTSSQLSENTDGEVEATPPKNIQIDECPLNTSGAAEYHGDSSPLIRSASLLDSSISTIEHEEIVVMDMDTEHPNESDNYGRGMIFGCREKIFLQTTRMHHPLSKHG